ncbi:MAG: helix-turn-helix transcriptional regulator [Acidobacteriaceae bacterium]
MRELKSGEIEYAIGRIEVYMTSRGLSQSDLAELSTVEQSTISKILHRKQEPSLENLQKLFGGLGLQIGDVLSAAAERLPKSLHGYLATPLTGLTEREDASVRSVVEVVRRVAATQFANPPISIYWPGEHTHPKSNPKYKPSTVYLIDRSRASTFHFLVILCGAASYGVGQENEIATQAGVPAIRLINPQVSRMMLGSFVKSFDIQYSGSLKEGIFFDEEELTKALRGIVKLHYSHSARYVGLNGNDFGPRLKKLVDERIRDYRSFADELGVSLDYVQAMTVEPLAISNPSTRLLKRMSILLGESVGFLLGEKEQDDTIYRESKESFNAWIRESEETVDARTAAEIFDQWKAEHFARKVESSPISLRDEVKPMRKPDWDERFRLAKAKKPSSGQRTMF